MNGYEFERGFVAALMALSTVKNLKSATLARQAWPDCKDAAGKWRKIRNGQPPQEFSLRDAFDIVATMELSMVDICALVQSRELAGLLAHHEIPCEESAGEGSTLTTK